MIGRCRASPRAGQHHANKWRASHRLGKPDANIAKHGWKHDAGRIEKTRKMRNIDKQRWPGNMIYH